MYYGKQEIIQANNLELHCKEIFISTLLLSMDLAHHLVEFGVIYSVGFEIAKS